MGYEFKFQEQVRFLTLEYNNLKAIPADTFNGLKKLQTIHLNNNQLTSVGAQAFLETDSLQNLFIGNNSLPLFPISANVFGTECKKSLRVMDISYNQIEELQTSQFAGLTSLVDLSVSNNKLKAITVNMMGGTSTTKLEKLDLSGNQIETIEDGSFCRST